MGLDFPASKGLLTRELRKSLHSCDLRAERSFYLSVLRNAVCDAAARVGRSRLHFSEVFGAQLIKEEAEHIRFFLNLFVGGGSDAVSCVGAGA